MVHTHIRVNKDGTVTYQKTATLKAEALESLSQFCIQTRSLPRCCPSIIMKQLRKKIIYLLHIRITLEEWIPNRVEITQWKEDSNDLGNLKSFTGCAELVRFYQYLLKCEKPNNYSDIDFLFLGETKRGQKCIDLIDSFCIRCFTEVDVGYFTMGGRDYVCHGIYSALDSQ